MLRFPPYPPRAHRTGQARIKIAGHTHYLGVHGSEASWEKYRRLLAEWKPGKHIPEPTRNELTIIELVARYDKFASDFYTSSSELRDIPLSVLPLTRLFGHSLAADFGPKSLKAVREAMITGSHFSEEEKAARKKKGHKTTVCRKTTNQRIDRIRRIFKWAVEEQIVDVTVLQALLAVAPLKEGKSDAEEFPEVLPVEPWIVEATLPILPAVIADMVALQSLTGMRPGEVCKLHPSTVDRGGVVVGGVRVWVAKMKKHKTARLGHKKAIVFGPQAQTILLRRWKDDAPFFSPAESMAEYRAKLRAARKSKVPPSQQNRKKENPKRTPKDQYTVASYGSAITKAIKRHNKQHPSKAIPHWHPHQLRHAAEYRIEEHFNLDAARHVLGHRDPRQTIRYGQQNLDTAAKVAAQIG